MVFLVLHQLLEQIARHIIARAVAMRRRLFVKRARGNLGLEIAIQDLLDVLADMQRIEHLHIGKAVQEDDAVDQLVGVLHLLDRFLAPLLGERFQTPVVQQAIVQPILIDGGELVPQRLVEIFDDLGFALHVHAPISARWAPETHWPGATNLKNAVGFSQR